MYSGPSPRNLVLSMLLHGAGIAALTSLSHPTVPADGTPADARATEIRISGKLYYVAQLDGSQSAASSTRPKNGGMGRSGGIAAPRAAAAGRSPRSDANSQLSSTGSPAPSATPPSPVREAPLAAVSPSPPPSNPSTAANPAPTVNPIASDAAAAKSMPPTPAAAADTARPDKMRSLRQQARTFIPPEVRPSPAATQTLIQPLSPPDLAPPPTALPNFRVLTDVRQMRKIPKRFEAPGRRTPPTPAQAPTLAAPALSLVPVPPAPVGDPLAVLSINDHPIPFSEKVVVPPGNIAQPPVESSGAAGAPSGTPGTGAAGGSRAPSRTGTTSGRDAAGTPASAAAGTGAPGASAATGVAGPSGAGGTNGGGTPGSMAGGAPDGNPTIIVGGNGAAKGSSGTGVSPNGAGPGTSPDAIAGAGAGSLSASPEAGSAPAAGTGTGTVPGSPTGGANASSPAAGRNTPGSLTTNRPPSGTFDAVVVQSSPVDQYPESRGLLSGRPIYSVYIALGTARDWTLFFCVPGEKPESGSGPVVRLGAMGAPVKAPYPTKLLKPAIALPSYEKYVLVHGTVNKDGKFEGLRLVRPIQPETDRALLATLADWEFRAATRDGVTIAVEFLLSIPAKGL